MLYWSLYTIPRKNMIDKSIDNNTHTWYYIMLETTMAAQVCIRMTIFIFMKRFMVIIICVIMTKSFKIKNLEYTEACPGYVFQDGERTGFSLI